MSPLVVASVLPPGQLVRRRHVRRGLAGAAGRGRRRRSRGPARSSSPVTRGSSRRPRSSPPSPTATRPRSAPTRRSPRASSRSSTCSPPPCRAVACRGTTGRSTSGSSRSPTPRCTTGRSSTFPGTGIDPVVRLVPVDGQGIVGEGDDSPRDHRRPRSTGSSSWCSSTPAPGPTGRSASSPWASSTPTGSRRRCADALRRRRRRRSPSSTRTGAERVLRQEPRAGPGRRARRDHPHRRLRQDARTAGCCTASARSTSRVASGGSTSPSPGPAAR